MFRSALPLGSAKNVFGSLSIYEVSESSLRAIRIASSRCSTDTLGGESIIGTIASSHRNRPFDSLQRVVSAIPSA